MKKSENFLNHGLQSANCHANVKASGVATLTSSGSRSVNSAHDSRNFYKTESLYLDFGLEGSRKAGVSTCTFATPQALFCARSKARKRITQILNDRGASNDLPTLQPDSNPGSRRVSGHSIHPQTAADAPSDRGRSRMAFPRINGESAEARCASGHKIYRGVSHQRNRIHSVHLPDAVTGIRQVRIIGLVNNLSTIKN